MTNPTAMSNSTPQVYFVGAGPGALDLLTVKATRLIGEADVIIYTDSLVNPEIASLAKPGAAIHRSAGLTLEQICDLMVAAAAEGKLIARVHTGDPSIFGAVLEQIAVLERHGIAWEIVPGVTSFVAAAAALGVELTVPDLVQSVIVTRVGGRTPMPPKEQLADLAAHQATMAFFLSITLMHKLVDGLLEGGYPPETPTAVMHKASWPDQVIVTGTLADIADKVKAAGIHTQSIVLVGEALDPGLRASEEHRSRLYDADFTHSFRRGSDWKPRHARREPSPQPSPTGRGSNAGEPRGDIPSGRGLGGCAPFILMFSSPSPC